MSDDLAVAVRGDLVWPSLEILLIQEQEAREVGKDDEMGVLT